MTISQGPVEGDVVGRTEEQGLEGEWSITEVVQSLSCYCVWSPVSIEEREYVGQML